MTRPGLLSSENATACDLANLNRQLMRFVLRAPGTPPSSDEERRLIAMIQESMHLTDEQMSDVYVRLIPRWRSGNLTYLTREYIRWALADQQRTERRWLPSPDIASLDRVAPGLSLQDQVHVRDLTERFRTSLTDAKEQQLYDAWILYEGQSGWKGEAARAVGRSKAWVSGKLKRFRTRLRESFGVTDAAAFVTLVRSLQGFLADEDECESTPVEEPVGVPGRPAGERACGRTLRDRLWDSVPSEGRDRQFMDDMARGAPCEAITQQYPDEPELLDRLHDQYRRLGEERLLQRRTRSDRSGTPAIGGEEGRNRK
jgi:hypothetical protein